MNKLLNDALRAKGYKGPDIKMVLTDVEDPNGPYYTDTLTNMVVFDRKMLASANRDEILNALGHEFGHYSKEDDIDKSQDIANHTGKLLEDRNIASGIYNIADDQPISTNELISLMGEVAKKRVRLWTIPSSLVSTAFKVGDILHLPINTNILNKLTGNFFISNQKLKDAINVEKLPSSTQEGLLKTLNSIKDK